MACLIGLSRQGSRGENNTLLLMIRIQQVWREEIVNMRLHIGVLSASAGVSVEFLVVSNRIIRGG
jgi:hypothetical protein